MKKILKITSKLFVGAFLIIALGSNSVYANTNIISGESPSLISNKATEKSSIQVQNGNSLIQGGQTLEKAENYANDKLGDIVHFLQSFIRPFTYVMFILSAIMIVIGVVSGSKHRFAGLIGMAVSIAVYVIVSFAPQIVEYFGSWLVM